MKIHLNLPRFDGEMAQLVLRRLCFHMCVTLNILSLVYLALVRIFCKLCFGGVIMRNLNEKMREIFEKAIENIKDSNQNLLKPEHVLLQIL